MENNTFYRKLDKFGREEIINLLCVCSDFEKDELLKMHDKELEDLWYELEVDEWIEETT